MRCEASNLAQRHGVSPGPLRLSSKTNPFLARSDYPRFIARKRLQLIARIEACVGVGAAFALLGMGLSALFLLFAESGLFECGDIFNCDCYRGGFAAEHYVVGLELF